MVQLGIIKEDNIMSDNTNNGFPVPEEPLTREEQYLSAIAGVTASSDIPEKPLTRVEAYLDKIVENGGGGGGGGTTNYNALENKPQINGTTLSGNKSSSDLGLQDTISFEGTYDSSNNKAATMSDIKDGKLTGYAQTSGNVAATDKVIEAIGKIEKKADDNQSNISSCKEFTDNATIDSNRKLYISGTEPTGTIPLYSTWIDGKTIKMYDMSTNIFDKTNPDTTINSSLNITQLEWIYINLETARVTRIACLPNTKYILTFSENVGNTILRIATTSSSNKAAAGVSVPVSAIINGGGIHSYTFTTNSTAAYILVQVDANDTIYNALVDSLSIVSTSWI